MFNLGFPDRQFLKVTKSGEKIYTSKTLDRIWGFGFASVGDVTFGSAAYVARYHLKKVGSVVSDNHYVNRSTGEILSPEYVTMSRGAGRNDPDERFRGGLGSGWIKKYMSDVYPRDTRVIKGVDTKPCKFYDSVYEVEDPESFKTVKLARVFRVDRSDNTEERLAVKEEVKLAQIRSLSSSLED